MNENTQENNPIVVIVNDRAVTTSWSVADRFAKRHADVLRAIQSLECPQEFSQRNFALAEYTDEQGKKRPMYEISRDGFTLLAMGFTGPEAMRFKIDYISAFNRMEEALRRIREEALVEQTKRDALSYFKKGAALAALVRRRDCLAKVEEFYWFRSHGQLTHYEAAQVANLSMPEADEIARTLREEMGLALPMIQGQVRRKEMSRYFAEAAGGFLPEGMRQCLQDLRKREVES